ncbi:D-xylose 1-dehydrogenase (NADP(+)) [Acrasis kona]|uniref:D-xylose 1-dehydrogenase (NADP(+), D-xylono-1,5-lactone-forming) n=1 Tax=Acrasis kona TaxID=1008807 RepID=A0AAW2YXQ7_9EUKA
MRTVLIITVSISLIIVSSIYSTDYPNIILRICNILGYGRTIPKVEKTIRIGVLGAANIAGLALIWPSKYIPTVEITTIAARSKQRAQAYAEQKGIPRVLDNYDDLINDPDIDAIYNPLPNSHHYEWTIKAIKAGKHVLCEKPFTSNAEEAESIAQAIKEQNTKGGANSPNQRFPGDVVVIEAMHWRMHPLALRIKEIINCGALGRILYTTTSMIVPYMPKDDIRFDFSLSGGAMMDVGAYAVSTSRWVSEQVDDPDYMEPEVLSATADMMPESDNIDTGMQAVLKYPNGVISNIKCSLWGGLKISPSISIVGDKGSLYVYNFVFPSAYHYLTVRDVNQTEYTEKVYGHGGPTFRYQLDAFSKVVRGEIKDWKSVGMPTIQDSITNMKVIDMIYQKSGLGKRARRKF